MRPVEKTCPDCDQTMLEGFLLDETEIDRHPVYWIAGEPERSTWVGLKLHGKEIWTVKAFRCPACGLLKTYARDKHR